MNLQKWQQKSSLHNNIIQGLKKHQEKNNTQILIER